SRIADRLDGLDVDDVEQLASAGAEIRNWIKGCEMPAELVTEVTAAYDRMGGGEPIPVAVRSSATAEDLP
ncbi:MAG: hypothetical protein GWN79_08200, partial [Actinobacteria bacterium]|nr:hypothetical protein [Actinomycetota bacterium]NIU66113.1 hypothetical protein [Actinomycetota bacterium]